MRLLKAVCRRMVGQWKSRELSCAFGGWLLVADDAKEAQSPKQAAHDCTAGSSQVAGQGCRDVNF